MPNGGQEKKSTHRSINTLQNGVCGQWAWKLSGAMRPGPFGRKRGPAAASITFLYPQFSSSSFSLFCCCYCCCLVRNEQNTDVGVPSPDYPSFTRMKKMQKTKTKRNIAPWNDNWSLCWTDLLCTHMYRAPANGILLRCRRKCDELLLCRNWNENNKKPFARNKYSGLFAKEIACGLNCVWNTKPAARLRLHKTISKCFYVSFSI